MDKPGTYPLPKTIAPIKMASSVELGPGMTFAAAKRSRNPVIAAAYVRFGSLPQVSGILYGIKPAMIADKRSEVGQDWWSQAAASFFRPPLSYSAWLIAAGALVGWIGRG